jgi:tetratricopeptide (TPR) repeat protein
VPAEQLRSALSAAGLPDTTTLTDSRAREVAVRTAVRAVVTGRVHRLSPDLVSLTLIAERAESGAELVRRSGTASTSGRELADLIARLGGSIRRELGDRSEELRSERLPQYVSTSSFAAFRLYADGLAAQRQGNYDGAIHVLKRSVLDDTGFASSWALLAMTYVAVRQPDSAQWAFDHALANAERLEPPERDRLRGDAAYNVDHDLETAATAYRRFLDQRPNSLGGWNNLGLYLSGLGRHEDALGAFVHANSIDPLVVGPRQVQLLNVGAELVLLGRLDSADAISNQLTGPPAEYLRMLLLNARNDWNALLDTAGRLADSPATQRYVRTPAQTHAAGAFAALGRESDADARLALSLASSHGADLRWHTQARLLFDLARGAAPAWELAPELVGDTAAGAVLLRGVHAAARNHLPAAERELALLQRRPSSVIRTVGRGREYLAALIAWKRGDLRSARAIVPLAQAGEHDPFSVDRPSSVAMRWLAAAVLEADGATTAAAEMRRLMREPVRLPPSHFALRGFVMRSP